MALGIVTILEGAEVRIRFYGRGGGIFRGDTPEPRPSVDRGKKKLSPLHKVAKNTQAPYVAELGILGIKTFTEPPIPSFCMYKSR